MFKFLRINKLNSWLLAWKFWFFNGMIVSQTKKLKKNCQKKRNFVTKFSKNHPKWLKFTYFVDNASKCIPYQLFFGKLQLFLPDSQKSRIYVVYLQNFSISRFIGRKKFWMSWVFWFYFMFQDISSKKKIFLPTDRKILQINCVNSWFLTISQK